jgi:hypothetical protein
MEPGIPDDKLTGIKNALFGGQKIQAIKLYRKATDAGLAEAKDAVEKLDAELRAASPEKFSAKSSSGCLSVMAVLCVVVGLVLLRLYRYL